MTLSYVDNAVSTKSRLDQTGLDLIVHFHLQILPGLAFGFWVSSKIQTVFQNFF